MILMSTVLRRKTPNYTKAILEKNIKNFNVTCIYSSLNVFQMIYSLFLFDKVFPENTWPFSR